MAEKGKNPSNGTPTLTQPNDYATELKSMGNRYRYLLKKDLRRGKVSYSELDTEELLGEELVPDKSQPTVEDAAIYRLLCEQLYYGLSRLPEDERVVIWAIYFEDMSERQFTERTGIPQRTVNRRKQRGLAKLKFFLENSK